MRGNHARFPGSFMRDNAPPDSRFTGAQFVAIVATVRLPTIMPRYKKNRA